MKTRIYFILADENLFHPHFFLGFMKKINLMEYEVAGITVAKATHKRGFGNFLKQQLCLWGITGFLFIVVNSVLRRMLTKLGSKKFSIEGIASRYNIPVITSYDVNEKEHIAYLEKLKVDIIISSNGHIFRSELLSVPRIASINRHTALLPKYGGVLPVFWAMFYNENTFGVSVHYMAEKIDTGNILCQKAISLEKHHSMFKNYILAFNISINVTIEALCNLKDKKIVKRNNSIQRSYFSFPSNKTIIEFKKTWKTFKLEDAVTYYKILGSVF